MKKLAVLIDADNASSGNVSTLFTEITKYGVASIKRAYGDWSKPHLKSWQDILLTYAITPIHQFAYTKGKDATDMQLIIDAMDLLYSNSLDGFCIVSSDSDYTPLASRIRTAGMVVYGFGRADTPQALQQVCNKFITLDSSRTDKANSKKHTIPQNDKKNSNVQKQPSQTTHSTSAASIKPKIISKQLRFLIYKGLIEKQRENSSWIPMAVMGAYLSQKQVGFDVKKYGYSTLSALFLNIPAVEVQKSSSFAMCKMRIPHQLDVKTLFNELNKLSKGEGDWVVANDLLAALSTKILLTRGGKSWLFFLEMMVAVGKLKERYDAENKLYYYQAR